MHRSGIRPAVETDESSSCEADSLHSRDNLHTARSTPPPRARKTATSSSAASKRRRAPESVARSVGSDFSDDNGSTTLVDSEEEEFSNDLRGLTLSVPGHKGRSHSDSECLESNRRSPSHRVRSKNTCNRSQYIPASNGDGIYASDSDNSNTSTSDAHEDSEARLGNASQSDDGDESSNASQSEDEEESSNASQSNDEDNSSDASQSDNGEYCQWAAAREAGLIKMISRALPGSEIMHLLCFGQPPSNLDKNGMVDCIELLMFKPDSSQLETWFIHKNWDPSVESELLKVVHLLNDSLARYDHRRRHCFPNNTVRQERHILKALELLRIHGKPQELVSLFTALLSCFSGKKCLAMLEAFGIAVDDYDWGLLKQRCLDKARMAESADSRYVRCSSR